METTSEQQIKEFLESNLKFQAAVVENLKLIPEKIKIIEERIFVLSEKIRVFEEKEKSLDCSKDKLKS